MTMDNLPHEDMPLFRDPPDSRDLRQSKNAKAGALQVDKGQARTFGRVYKDQILKLLQSSEQPVDRNDLIKINHRFSCCIQELREDGYVIEITNDPKTNRPRYYEITGRIETFRTSRGWQEAYYMSDHWQRVREERLWFDLNQCVLCHAEDELEVHHWTYELFNEDICHLSTLCRECHMGIHTLISIAFPRSVDATTFKRLVGWEKYI